MGQSLEVVHKIQFKSSSKLRSDQTLLLFHENSQYKICVVCFNTLQHKADQYRVRFINPTNQAI